MDGIEPAEFLDSRGIPRRPEHLDARPPLLEMADVGAGSARSPGPHRHPKTGRTLGVREQRRTAPTYVVHTPEHPDTERLLTTSDVAAFCQVSPRTVTNWVAAGRLIAGRPGGRSLRYRQTDLDRFITESTVKPQPIPAVRSERALVPYLNGLRVGPSRNGPLGAVRL